jgi:O-antigen ligase
MLLAWGVLSFLWTIDAKRTAGVSASFAGIGLCGFILIAFARLAGPRERNMVGNASLAAAWVGIAFIAFEAMIDLALIKWLWPLLGQVPPKFLVYLNFPMLVLTPLVPVGAAYALYRGWWWMALVLYGTALALASQMESGTALLALAASGAAIVIFAVLPGRLRLPSALLVVALGMAFVPALGRTLYNSETVVRIFAWVGDSASHRLSMWNRLGSLIAKRPVLGVGMGASRSMPEGKIRVPIRPAPPGAGEKANRSPLVPTIAMHPHNIGLEVGLELGLIGLLLAFGFLAAMVMGGFRLGADRWGQAGVAALAVSSTTSGMMGLSVWNFSYVSAHLIAIAALVVWTPQSAAAGINPGSQPS